MVRADGPGSTVVLLMPASGSLDFSSDQGGLCGKLSAEVAMSTGFNGFYVGT